MLDKFLLSILHKLNRNNSFTDIQLEEIKYSIKVIWADLSKFVILFVIFSFFHYQIAFLYAYITTCLLRIYIGGNHLKTYYGCLLFSSIYFSALLIFTRFYNPEYKPYVIILSIVSIIILLLIAPQIPRKSGRKVKKKLYRVKLAILVLVIFYMTLFIVNKEPIFSIGPLTIVLQSIQLLILKGENYYEIKKEGKISTISS